MSLHCVAHRPRQRAGRRERTAASHEGRCDVLRQRLIRVVAENRSQPVCRRPLEPLRGGETAPRVHAHVERAIDLEREAARRIIDLHRGHAEIGEEEVDAVVPANGADCGAHAGKIRATDEERRITEAEPAQARLRLGQLDWVGIESEEPPAWRELLEKPLRVPAPTEGRVHAALTRLQGQRRQHFLDQDRYVLPRRCLPARAQVRDHLGVLVGRELLVLLTEVPRMRTAVARPALVDAFRVLRRLGHDAAQPIRRSWPAFGGVATGLPHGRAPTVVADASALTHPAHCGRERSCGGDRPSSDDRGPAPLRR